MSKFTTGDLDALYALVVEECKKRTLPGQNLSKACANLTFTDNTGNRLNPADMNEILKILQMIEQGKNSPTAKVDGKKIQQVTSKQKASNTTIVNAEEYINTLSSYSGNKHNNVTGCANSSCQGLCMGLCFGTCSGGCSSDCDGGCGGCRQNCASACSQDCRTHCGGFCDSYAGGPDGSSNSNCSSECSGACDGGCLGGCQSACHSTCGGAGSCHSSCSGTCYKECKGCDSNCTATCQSNCSTHCGSNCKGVAGFSV